MSGKRNMFAQLPQELAFTAGETVRLAASGNKHAKDFAFDQQRRNHQRAQPSLAESLRKGHVNLRDIGLVDQISPNAAA